MESENLMLASRHSSLSLPSSLPPPPSFFPFLSPSPASFPSSSFSSSLLLLPLFLLPSPVPRSFSLSLSLSLLPTWQSPYCIQIHQSPYKAAQLNMSHIIYPQPAASSPFTAHAWIVRRRGRRGQRRGTKLRQTSTVNSHVPTISHSARVYAHLLACVYVNKCRETDREKCSWRPKNAIHLPGSNSTLSLLPSFPPSLLPVPPPSVSAGSKSHTDAVYGTCPPALPPVLFTSFLLTLYIRSYLHRAGLTRADRGIRQREFKEG